MAAPALAALVTSLSAASRLAESAWASVKASESAMVLELATGLERVGRSASVLALAWMKPLGWQRHQRTRKPPGPL